MIDRNFGNVIAGVLFSKVAYQRKRWLTLSEELFFLVLKCFSPLTFSVL